MTRNPTHAHPYDERRSILADRLDRLWAAYDMSFLDPDPLVVVRRYSDPRDREIAGLFAAALAFGGVRTIMRDAEDLFRRMGAAADGGLRQAIVTFDPAHDAARLAGWYHRFVRGEDVAALAWAVRRAIEAHGSLGALFAEGFNPADRDIGPALAAFVRYLRGFDPAPVVPGPFYGYLLASPEDGSACKRMNLYLRWMVRREVPDLGLWRQISPSHLVMPVDTHVARICRSIGLTARRTADWRMAREITDALAAIDPADPVKYDYAISRLGILERCPRRRDPMRCADCLIGDLCIL